MYLRCFQFLSGLMDQDQTVFRVPVCFPFLHSLCGSSLCNLVGLVLSEINALERRRASDTGGLCVEGLELRSGADPVKD